MNLNKLMTSDFIEGHSPDELRGFLLEFRKNYRVLHNETLFLNRELRNREDIIEALEQEKNEIQQKNKTLANHLDRRDKLTWKERLTGKINKVKYGS